MDFKRANWIILLLILLLSIVGITCIAIGPFAEFYLVGYYSGLRYSCLGCEYSTMVDYIAQILMIILLSGMIILTLNALLEDTLFSLKRINIIGAVLGVLISAFAIIGGAAFSIWYAEYAVWYDVGYYGGLIAGLCGAVLFIIREKYS